MATIKALVVAGGGGGANKGGGGGAGGFLHTSDYTVNYQIYSVVVGAGGSVGTNGSNSSFNTLTAVGGGAGGVTTGGNGGSGGGAGETGTYNGGTATTGQGYNGGNSIASRYSGGGGGGAGAVGTDGAPNRYGGPGGIGNVNPIIGSTSGQNVSGTYYLAGGGGGAGGNGVGLGGYGGGGKGERNYGYYATAGTVNTGGGGGAGTAIGGSIGASGGSGIVILSWLTADFGTCSITGSGNAITTSGENSIATFITSGDITFVENISPTPTPTPDSTPTPTPTPDPDSTPTPTPTPIPGFSAKALVVAGGGGGANSGGGGGAGGFLYTSNHTINYQTYSVVVGAGGAGGAYSGSNGTISGNKGYDSVFSTLTAIGGGFGGGVGLSNGGNGGSGGGGGLKYQTAPTFTGGLGTAGQGYNGGDGCLSTNWVAGSGGGGGAGQAGSNGTTTAGSGNGGNGLANPISGSTAGQLISTTYYLAGGGGGGENYTFTYVGTGGNGGGGNANVNAAGTAGTANTGGGGGGGSQQNGSPFILYGGGNGGSGVVIISWPKADSIAIITGAGNTITLLGTNYIATFITSGDITFTLPLGRSNFGLYNKRPSTITKGYYNFNDDSLDTSGNNMNGTDTSMTYSTGKYNLCASFNGSNGRIQLPDAAGINTTFTFNAFIKLNGTNNNTIYSKGSDASNGWGCMVELSTTALVVAVVTTTPTTAQQTLSQTISLNTGEYYMLTVVFDNSARTLKGYINGNLIKSISTGANLRGTNNVFLGVNKAGASFSNYFNGQMDELVIENRVWTDDEIRKFYTYSRGNFGII